MKRLETSIFMRLDTTTADASIPNLLESRRQEIKSLLGINPETILHIGSNYQGANERGWLRCKAWMPNGYRAGNEPEYHEFLIFLDRSVR